MTAEKLLSRLDKVREIGSNQWIARCPAHNDRGPSLSIKETDDQKVLIFDHAGCSPSEVVKSVGLELTDLFPEPPSNDYRSTSKFKKDYATMADWKASLSTLQQCGIELMIACAKIGQDGELSERDYQSLRKAFYLIRRSSMKLGVK